jgi:GNAT superfamily N-acetyltransferase
MLLSDFPKGGTMGEIIYRDGLDSMDFERVTGMLSQAYWCIGIGIDEVRKSAENSALVVGAFDETERQVGYARAISDKLRFAYVVDVYVDEGFRRRGIGQGMMRHMLVHPALADVYQWLLITRDAHEVYKKVGFSVVSRPLDWMEIRKPRPPQRAMLSR